MCSLPRGCLSGSISRAKLMTGECHCHILVLTYTVLAKFYFASLAVAQLHGTAFSNSYCSLKLNYENISSNVLFYRAFHISLF